MAVRGRQVAAALILLQFLSVHANATTLEILPNGDVQTKSIGSRILLTCRPNVPDPNLITHIEWRDPLNRVIESLGSSIQGLNVQGNSKPLMYTEIREGKALALYFNSLQEDQAGVYSCRATYANTEPLSKNVTIDTIVSIHFEDAPANQYPIFGEDFPIKCKVRARPSPTVDWLYNGEVITTNDRFIIETHALKIKNVQESDDGIYTCRAAVENTGQLEERAIRVEVHKKPEIIEGEQRIEITEGKNANIECKATGKPPPKFSWVKSLTQQNLATADRFGVDEDTGILTITNVNREDDGEYQCIATNAAGRAIRDITVSVLVKPKIMEYLNATSVVDKKAEIRCKAFGRPPPKVVFRKHTSEKPYEIGLQFNNDRILLENKIDDMKGETTAILTVENVLRSDDGLYECIASNKGGENWRTGHLTVEFPPSFAGMKNLTIWSWEQRPVNLTCIAESIPNATIRWQLNGYEIDNDQQIKIIGKGPVSTLEILPLDKRYYANYKCIASNIHGTRDHHILLMEAHKPDEILQAKFIEITATSAKFDLVGPVAVHPELLTLSVQYKHMRHTWTNARNKTWTVNSPYILEGLTPETTYDFRFRAENEVGPGNWGKNLQETTLRRSFPSEPKMLIKYPTGMQYESSQYSTQFELSWLIPSENGEPIDSYQVKYCPIQPVGGNWEPLTGCVENIVQSRNRTRHWIKKLDPDTFYQAEITAHNKFGYSPPGTMRFKTAKGHETVMQHDGPLISSAAIIGIVIAVLFILIIVIDVICCCANKTGIIFYVCERSRRKPVDEDDAKLGREEKEPLREEKKITPIIDSGLRRETSVNFNGKTSVSKTGFVGKDSAV